jgi:hypothetical protein
MSDTASLIVRVSQTGIGSTTKGLSSLTSSAVKATGAITGLASAGAALSKLVSVTRQTDILNASLLTMTGSSANAALAFRELEKFANNTPYALEQSVTAFTKLVSLGLNPSQKALMAYGNTAAAMGKDLNQMIEAVADATTGEFERLKEFGIKASQQGDKVSFTFQGVTTTVKKNAAEIEGYLQGIGENNFAGAMENRMATLDGAISNLADSWDGLFRAISSQGAGGIIEDQVREATAALNELNVIISSGQGLGYLNAWGGQWQSTTEDIKVAIDSVDAFIKEKLMDWGMDAVDSSNVMSDAFWQFPTNIRAAVQIATVEMAGFVDKTKIWGEALNPENWLLTIDEFSAKYADQFAAIDKTVLDTNTIFLNERDKRISKVKSELEAADQLRIAYERQQSGPGADLSQFSIAPDAGSSNKPSEAESNKLQKQKDDAAAYLETLRQANLNEMQLISTQEQEKAAKVQEYRELGLVTEQEYQDALTEIQTNAVLARAEISNKILDDEAKKQEDVRKESIATEIAIANAKAKVIDDGIEGQRNMTTDLKNTLGEQNDLYKASAIVTATINTYQAATGAFAAMAAIPIVGPALGAVAAGLAITAGLANVAAISGAREQGGYMTAGGAYQMAERGKAEVIVPAGNSIAKTANQMRDIMGQSGGGGVTGVTIVNNTTGRVDNATTEVDNEGMLHVIIDEYVSAALLTQDSTIAKARKASSNQPGF